jgi:hypothetical protein
MEAPAQAPGQQQGETPQSHSLRWLWWSGIFVACYLLASGPAVKLAVAHPAALRFVAAVYAPLEALYQHSDLAHKVIDWYVEDVWKVK